MQKQTISQTVNGELVTTVIGQPAVLSYKNSFQELVPATVNFCRNGSLVQIFYAAKVLEQKEELVERFKQNLQSLAKEGETFEVTDTFPAFTVKWDFQIPKQDS